MTAFTAAAADLAGPPWLAARRADAVAALAGAAWPSEAEEIWRYSGIDRFDLDRYRPVAAGDVDAAGWAAAEQAAAPFGPVSALVVTAGGVVAGVHGGAAGLRVGSGRDVVDGAAIGLGAVARPRDAFGQLHDAFLADVVAVEVARSAVIADPVVVVHLVAGQPGGVGGDPAQFPRTVVRLERAAEATVIELLVTPGDRPADGLVVRGAW